MVCSLLFLAGICGTVELSPIPVLTPSEILADRAEFSSKTIDVRFKVGSIRSQTITTVDNQTYQQMIIYPVFGDTKDAEFYIAITPQVEKAFNRLGISNLKQHFKGKEVEVQGSLSVTYRNIYASPTFSMYHIDITDLDQIRMIKAVKSKQPNFSFKIPPWHVSNN